MLQGAHPLRRNSASISTRCARCARCSCFRDEHLEIMPC